MNVIFDLGGVVVRWDPKLIVETFTEDPRLRESLLDGVFRHPDWLEQDRGTLDREAAVVRAADRIGISRTTIDAVLNHTLSTVVPLEPTLSLIERVRERGHGLYCLSNMHQATMDYLDTVHRISELFDGGVISYRVKAVKPEPTIFEILCDRYGLDRARSVFVDDSKSNIDAAAELGFQVVHFRSAGQCERELRALGVLGS